jgi:hypothetical protein
MSDQFETLKVQTGLAVAALGISFAQTLAADDVPPAVLACLRKRSQEAYDQLRADGDADAATIFGEFVRALNDDTKFRTRSRSTKRS